MSPGLFDNMGDEGFEPPTSSILRRANILTKIVNAAVKSIEVPVLLRILVMGYYCSELHVEQKEEERTRF